MHYLVADCPAMCNHTHPHVLMESVIRLLPDFELSLFYCVKNSYNIFYSLI